MATGPKAGWGGARVGAGRKHTTFSAENIKKRKELAEKFARENKKTVDEILLAQIYEEGIGKRDLHGFMKLWYEISEPRIQEGGPADEANGPGIYLPGERPDPAKVVPMKKSG